MTTVAELAGRSPGGQARWPRSGAHVTPDDVHGTGRPRRPRARVSKSHRREQDDGIRASPGPGKPAAGENAREIGPMGGWRDGTSSRPALSQDKNANQSAKT